MLIFIDSIKFSKDFYHIIYFGRLTGFLLFNLTNFFINQNEKQNCISCKLQISYFLLSLHFIFLILSLQIINDYIEKYPSLSLNTSMAKHSKKKSYKTRKPQSLTMELRSEQKDKKQEAKVQNKIEAESIDLEKEFDEKKIINQFKMKRKILMHALKQKQKGKEKFQNPITLKQFHDQEGEDQRSIKDSQIKQFGTLIVNEPISPNSQSYSYSQSTVSKISLESALNQSSKKNVGIQIQMYSLKTKQIKKTLKQKPKVTEKVQMNQQQIKLKDVEVVKLKRAKKTPEDIERIKSQISTVLLKKQHKNETKKNIQSAISSSLPLSLQEFNLDIKSSIQNINLNIERYYKDKYLKEIILKQSYSKQNKTRKYQRSTQSKESSIKSLSDKNSKQIQSYQLQKKDNVASQNKIIEEQTKKVVHFQNLNNNFFVDQALIKLQSPLNSKISKQSEPRKTINRKIKSNIRRKLNERFQMVVNEPSLQQQINDLTNQDKNIPQTNTQVKSTQQVIKPKISQKKMKSQEQDFYKDQSEDETAFNPMQQWITQFKLQMEVICKRYPNLIEYCQSQRKNKIQHKKISLQRIQNYCSKKKIITKDKKQKVKQKHIKNSFKQKISNFSRKKVQGINKRLGQIKQKSIKIKECKQRQTIGPLKQLQIAQNQQQQFGKSIDLRCYRVQQYKNRVQIIRKQSQIYNVLNNLSQKSSNLQLQNQCSQKFNNEQSLQYRDQTFEYIKKQKKQFNYINNVKGLNQSNDQSKGSIKNKSQWSFFRSADGQQYFVMSGQIN